jgi:hypothetical protein
VTAGGKDTDISLQTDDVDAYHSQLKERGVNVDAEVSRFGDAPRIAATMSALVPSWHKGLVTRDREDTTPTG